VAYCVRDELGHDHLGPPATVVVDARPLSGLTHGLARACRRMCRGRKLQGN
jgi:hypothetical protein